MAVQQARHNGGGGSAPGTGTIARARRTGNERQENGSTARQEERIATALGWFSLGLGLAQIAVPGEVARLIGVRDDDDNRAAMRAIGLREIASGVGILTQPRPTGWLWTRVAGDMMDLALLSRALGSDRADRGKVAAATAAVAGVTVVDLFCSERLSHSPDGYTAGTRADRGVHVTKTLTINRPAEELYRFIRDFENLPRFMHSVESVHVSGDNRSHWRARGPAGAVVECDVEVSDDRPNERIAWQSLEGSHVAISAVVRFQPAPGGRGTEVRVEMQFSPPGGVIGATLSRFLGGGLEQQVLEDLRRFKQLMETGEIVLSEAKIGRERPAQPPPEELWSRVAVSSGAAASVSR